MMILKIVVLVYLLVNVLSWMIYLYFYDEEIKNVSNMILRIYSYIAGTILAALIMLPLGIYYSIKKDESE